jgi:2-amino-4-hydroxy-6-hydroxymethyldihydropteridine diphosphokinase
MSSHRAFVGIGSNLGDRTGSVDRAVTALSKLGAIVGRSSLYNTAPWGKTDQPSFVNAVVLLETQLAPRSLLESLQAIEKRLGRTPAERWGPRIVDLDLLLYDDLEIDEPELRLPHPHLHERAFVLVPLAELDEHFAAMRDALRASELAGVVPIESFEGMPRSARSLSESVTTMSLEPSLLVGERVRALARFLTEGDAVRVRVQYGDDNIEIARRPQRIEAPSGPGDRAPGHAAPLKIDTIKADLVGIFHLGRPTPVEGDVVDGDRELGYVEALGIRTPVRSMGAGRLVAIATADGAPVEYGQRLFLVARGQ